MAKLKDRQALAVRRVNADTVQAFCTALKERFTDPTSGLGKAYLRLLVDDIRFDGSDWSSPAATGVSQTPSASCRKESSVKCPAS